MEAGWDRGRALRGFVLFVMKTFLLIRQLDFSEA